MAKYKLIAYDVDGTLTDDNHFIWQTLHDYFQTDRALRNAYKAQFFNHGITYQQWFEYDLQMMIEKGADRQSILAAIEHIQPMPGAYETIRALKSKGFIQTVISGSLNIVLDHVLSQGHTHGQGNGRRAPKRNGQRRRARGRLNGRGIRGLNRHAAGVDAGWAIPAFRRFS